MFCIQIIIPCFELRVSILLNSYEFGLVVKKYTWFSVQNLNLINYMPCLKRVFYPLSGLLNRFIQEKAFSHHTGDYVRLFVLFKIHMNNCISLIFIEIRVSAMAQGLYNFLF